MSPDMPAMIGMRGLSERALDGLAGDGEPHEPRELRPDERPELRPSRAVADDGVWVSTLRMPLGGTGAR